MHKKEHSKMIDNRMVNDNHQQGIARVVQRKGAMEVGQPGKMKAEGHANWKRSGGSLTPRRA